MKHAKEIALAFPRGAHQEELINGVLRYAAEHGCNWTYITAPESLALSVLDLKGWRGDGIIAALNTPAEASCAKGLSLPIVNISATLAKTPVPRVSVDSRLVGELAADHLIERGFQQFALLRTAERRVLGNSATRIRRPAGHVGLRCVALLMPPTYRVRSQQWRDQQRKLVQWLGRLPKPVGLFAVTDYRARQALDACRQVGVRVPQQVAVIGVDNEEVICAHVQPQLSSVARNNRQEGYHAAAMLDLLDPPQAAAEHGRDDSAAGRRGPRIDGDGRVPGSAAVRRDRLFEPEHCRADGRAGVGVARGRLAAVDGVCVSRGARAKVRINTFAGGGSSSRSVCWRRTRE